MKLNLGLVKILKFMLPREIFDNMGEIQNVYYMFHASLLSLNKQKENFSVASSHWSVLFWRKQVYLLMDFFVVHGRYSNSLSK